MERFAKIINGEKVLTIVPKLSIKDICGGPDYVSTHSSPGPMLATIRSLKDPHQISMLILSELNYLTSFPLKSLENLWF